MMEWPFASGTTSVRAKSSLPGSQRKWGRGTSPPRTSYKPPLPMWSATIQYWHLENQAFGATNYHKTEYPVG